MGVQAVTEIARAMSEEDLARNVIDAALKLGWLVKRDPTWRPTSATPGYPDLTMVRNGRLIFAELKREGKDPTDAQRVWLEALANVAFSVQAYTWRPLDWLDGTIEEILR